LSHFIKSDTGIPLSLAPLPVQKTAKGGYAIWPQGLRSSEKKKSQWMLTDICNSRRGSSHHCGARYWLTARFYGSLRDNRRRRRPAYIYFRRRSGPATEVDATRIWPQTIYIIYKALVCVCVCVRDSKREKEIGTCN